MQTLISIIILALIFIVTMRSYSTRQFEISAKSQPTEKHGFIKPRNRGTKPKTCFFGLFQRGFLQWLSHLFPVAASTQCAVLALPEYIYLVKHIMSSCDGWLHVRFSCTEPPSHTNVGCSVSVVSVYIHAFRLKYNSRTSSVGRASGS